jgi:hypothetical protein
MTSDLDGKPYDPNDPEQVACLRKAKCYVDRTVDPPVIRVIVSENDYEITGWVWLREDGTLRKHDVDGVKVVENGRFFVYKGTKYPPGIYYLIRKDGRESLVSEKFLETL